MSQQSMRDSMGRKVVAVDNAEAVGTVKSFVVDVQAERVEKIQVSGRKKKAMFAAWSDLASFGDDVVMLAASERVDTATDARDQEAARGGIALLGARILDTDGFERGTVVDVRFDGATGVIDSVQGSQGLIEKEKIRSLGSYALVITAPPG